jgi:hypothetical protein
MVQAASPRGDDLTYDMIVPAGFDEKFSLLRRAIRDRAIEVGVDLVTSGP